jgi:nucleoside-diphosphate-sugar epimerase
MLEARGHEVYRMSRGSPSGEKDLAADLTDPNSVVEALRAARPEAVVHLAGTSNLADTEAARAFAINAEGTRNLLVACEQADGPRRILVASSAYVYGDTGGGLARETDALHPENEYGRSKLEMERIALAFARHREVLIVRPFNYTGLGHPAHFLVPKVIRLIRKGGSDASFVDPDIVRDFSDVRWIAAAYAHVLEMAAAPPVLNFCSGIAMRLDNLVELACRVAGARHRMRCGPSLRASVPCRSLAGSSQLLEQTTGLVSPDFAETLKWMLAS